MVNKATKPWWQMAQTPAFGFWLGGFWLLFGVLRWSWLAPDDGWLGVALTAAFLLLGLSYVASSIALVRRRGTDRDGADRHQADLRD